MYCEESRTSQFSVANKKSLGTTNATAILQKNNSISVQISLVRSKCLFTKE